MITKKSETLFTLYAALNCAGYDDENHPGGMHPVRTTVRSTLRSVNREQMAFAAKAVETAGALCLNHWAMWHSEPPDFQPLASTKNHLPEVALGLSAFWQKHSLRDLWLSQSDAYDKDAISLQDSGHHAYNRMSLFFGHNIDHLARHVKLVSNLLESHNRACAITLPDGHAIVCGSFFTPSRFSSVFSDIRGFQVCHELLHVLFRSLDPKPMKAILESHPSLPAGISVAQEPYASWPQFIEECLVRAANIYLWMSDSPRHVAQMVEHEAQAGLSVVPHIYNHLARQSRDSPPAVRLITATIQGVDDRMEEIGDA